MGIQWRRWKSWIAVPLIVLCVGAGGGIGGSAGISLIIWLVEGGDVFKEFLYAHPGPGKVTVARSLGLVIGAGLGSGLMVFLLALVAWKLGLIQTSKMSSKSR